MSALIRFDLLKDDATYLLFVGHSLTSRTCRRTFADHSLIVLVWPRLRSRPNARPECHPWTRTMSAAIQFTGAPIPLNRPCTITKSPSATIVPGSYFNAGGRLLIRLNRPSRPGAI